MVYFGGVSGKEEGERGKGHEGLEICKMVTQVADHACCRQLKTRKCHTDVSNV